MDANINRYYHKFVGLIIQAMDGWDFQAEYATTNLVADQEEYVFPSNTLKIKRIEVTYDGTNWYEVTPFDINETGYATNETNKDNNFITSQPYGDIMDNSVFLYPTPSVNVTGGLKIWYEKEVTPLSSATDEPNIAEPFQEGLALGAARENLIKHIDKAGNTIRLSETNKDLEDIIDKMQNFYRGRVQDQKYELSMAYEDYGYGDN